MSNRKIFTKEQINKLSANKNVVKCSKKYIKYSDDFKINAIRQYCNGDKSFKQIFEEAGFDLKIIGERTPADCFKEWKEIFKKKGEIGLISFLNKKGRHRIRTDKITDTEKIKILEVTIAYLRAENEFLVKLRSGKTE